MINYDIKRIYIMILKEGWRIHNCKHMFGGIQAVRLKSPDRSDGVTIWLVPSNYFLKPLNEKVKNQIYEALHAQNGDEY